MPNSDPLLGLRFDSVSERYHEVRPRYPAPIWDALMGTTGLQPGARVLEIGAGTGIATTELVRRGLNVTVLEPGAAMAAIVARDLVPTGQVGIHVGRLENFVWQSEPFDLVIGATSLHWLDRDLLHRRMRELVRPGGYAALLYYQHVAGGDMAFFDAAQGCYETHAPSIANYTLRESDGDIPSVKMLDGMPGFTERHRERWMHQVASDRKHYLALLSTYSGHLALSEDERRALLDCIGDLIDGQFGGRIVKQYRYDLVVMQRNL